MNNLKQFENYDIYGKTEEVMSHIDFIDELIKLKKFNYVPLEARKILEVLLVDDFKAQTLNSSIKKFSITNNIPLIIEKSLMFIKEKGNEAAHTLSLFEKNYGLDFDINSVIEIVKNLFIVLRYFVELKSGFSIDISTIKFIKASEIEQLVGNNRKKVLLEEIPKNHSVIYDKRKKGWKTVKKIGTEEDRMKSLVKLVGMSSFINYFMEWGDFESYSKRIIKDTNISTASVKIKASGSKSIVNQGYTKIALEYIASSKRVDSSVSRKAKKILKENNY